MVRSSNPRPVVSPRARASAMTLRDASPKLMVAALMGASIVALALMAKPAHASRVYTESSVGSLASVSLIDRDSGRVLPVYRYRGEYWVAGNPGSKYSIAVTNRQGARVLAVVSVDGVNVLTGETAAFEQTGYVFNGHQRYDVSGWRKSDHEIAAFNFVASPRSYAERTGRPDHVGTIGVALFRERYEPPRFYPAPDYRYRYEGQDSSRELLKRHEAESSPAPTAQGAPGATADGAKRSYSGAAGASRAEEKLGTGHGRREWDSVTRTTFERASSQPAEVIRIRYDSRENLIAMGVIPDSRRPWDRTPNPFPDSFGNNGYVPDPPRWYR
jgi:hypothetical protein